MEEDFALKNGEEKKSLATKRKEREKLDQKRKEIATAPKPKGILFGFIHQVVYTNYTGPVTGSYQIPEAVLRKISEQQKYLFYNMTFQNEYKPSQSNYYLPTSILHSSPAALAEATKKHLSNVMVEGGFKVTIFGKTKETFHVSQGEVVSITHKHNPKSLAVTTIGFAWSEEVLRQGHYATTKRVVIKD
eukprot:TRINITY_DN11570_c1_g1_i1.p1 TRINITY_DN11570_c1_g1~~TRINITY_DN11570_c1_g1_i1.p1  ORF type:complete len:189 (-),score=42.24 TRINITY_DN11570_c1_g1_i1:213-779(-)